MKVAALGEGNPIGFADDLRPPGSDSGRAPAARQSAAARAELFALSGLPGATAAAAISCAAALSGAAAGLSAAAYPPQAYPAQAAASAPMSIYRAGRLTAGARHRGRFRPAGAERATLSAAAAALRRAAAHAAAANLSAAAVSGAALCPAQPYPAQPAEQVPLGRERTPVTTGAVAVQPVATLACPIVSALDTWFAGGVQPAAMKWFGVPVAEIKQISAYSCRGMNGQRGRENLRACVRQCARHRVVHARGRAQDHREGRLARAPRGAGLPARRACVGLPAVSRPCWRRARTPSTTTTSTWT